MLSSSGGPDGHWRQSKRRWLCGRGRGRGRRGRSSYVVLGKDSEETKGRANKSWRIRVCRRLQILRKLASPRRLLTRLRDAYVSMMMGFASSAVVAGGGAFDFYGVRNPLPTSLKEYDEKMIVQIYRSMVADKHLVPSGPAISLS
ncbi:uncharacterized protein LOC144709535 [Wolffia australiana]